VLREAQGQTPIKDVRAKRRVVSLVVDEVFARRATRVLPLGSLGVIRFLGEAAMIIPTTSWLSAFVNSDQK